MSPESKEILAFFLTQPGVIWFFENVGNLTAIAITLMAIGAIGLTFLKESEIEPSPFI